MVHQGVPLEKPVERTVQEEKKVESIVTETETKIVEQAVEPAGEVTESAAKTLESTAKPTEMIFQNLKYIIKTKLFLYLNLKL